jgi:hypothetical protein
MKNIFNGQRDIIRCLFPDYPKSSMMAEYAAFRTDTPSMRGIEYQSRGGLHR